jgi:hypothetical protein
MKKYPSTEELRKTFDYIDGYLYWKIKPSACVSIGNKAGTTKGNNGYCRIQYKGSSYLVHRLIWVWHGNVLDPQKEIDHINRKRDDNRIENLRQTIKAENLANQKCLLVCFCPSVKSKNKWKAYTKQSGTQKQKHLGYYRTREEALRVAEAI